jgi:hypothetical protein
MTTKIIYIIIFISIFYVGFCAECEQECLLKGYEYGKCKFLFCSGYEKQISNDCGFLSVCCCVAKPLLKNVTSGIFRAYGFNCISIDGGKKCSISYENLIGEDVIFLFMFTDNKGRIVSVSSPIINQGSGSVSSLIFCNSVGSGNYMVQWRAYRVSDQRLLKEIAWSKTNEIIKIVC